MPVTLLTDEPVTLTNAPILRDIKTADACIPIGYRNNIFKRWKVLVMSSQFEFKPC